MSVILKLKKKVMKNKFIYSIILVAGFLFAGSSGNTVYSQTPQNTPAKLQTMKYTCPMHTEVVSDKPGNCPKCGMALVEKKDMKMDNMHQMHDSTTMKKDEMKTDSTTMNKDKMKMKRDSTTMKKGPIYK